MLTVACPTVSEVRSIDYNMYSKTKCSSNGQNIHSDGHSCFEGYERHIRHVQN